MSERAEQQLEIDAPREAVFELLATADGLRSWMDAAELDQRVGGELRVRLRDAEAVGKILALDPPQHISYQWDWADSALGAASVVAFDAIDHGARTHVTLRHVGLRTAHQVHLHEEMWRYWLERFDAACRALPNKEETTHP